jgi:hypothetical protein
MQNDFHQCFWSWKSLWNCCMTIKVEGDYFKGDGGE